MNNLHIILRVCDKEIPESHKPRPAHWGTKTEIFEKCFRSLVDNIKDVKYTDVILTTVRDHITNTKILETLDTAHKRGVRSYYCDMTRTTGNAASIGVSLDKALAGAAFDHIFFVEDDYLFQPGALQKMMEAYNRISLDTKLNVCVHPTDYPDRYKGAIEPCHIFLAANMHWRTIKKTTGTVMMPYKVLVQNWDNISAFRNYGIKPGYDEDNTINKIYQGNTICISPIPGLAHHYQYEETLSPYVGIPEYIDLPDRQTLHEGHPV